MHHALSFHRGQHPRRWLIPGPFWMITIVWYVERAIVRNDRSRKLPLLYLLSFGKWNRANVCTCTYRLRLCRINYLSLSPGIDDTIVSDASNERHLLEALDLFCNVVHKLACACTGAVACTGCSICFHYLKSTILNYSLFERFPVEKESFLEHISNSKFWSSLSLIFKRNVRIF